MQRSARIAIDIGNSRICCGEFDGDKLKDVWHYRVRDAAGAAKDLVKRAQGIDSESGVAQLAMGSVVPSAAGVLLEEFSKNELSCFEVHAKSQSVLKDLYETMGADRIANAAAAAFLYLKDGAAVVLDFGTATTLTAVDSERRFRGGLITLGLASTFNVLHESAEQLPQLNLPEVGAKVTPLMFDTPGSIRSGCLLAQIGAIEYWVNECKKQLPANTTVIATGGLSTYLAPLTPVINHIDSSLTLRGIQIIAEEAMALMDQG